MLSGKEEYSAVFVIVNIELYLLTTINSDKLSAEVY